VLLRPVPVRTATGTIRSKTWQPAGEYWQFPVGMRGSFREPTRVPLAEHYLLRIEAEGQPEELRYPVNTVAAEGLEVGQRGQPALHAAALGGERDLLRPGATAGDGRA
jgi:hypothetical protein